MLGNAAQGTRSGLGYVRQGIILLGVLLQISCGGGSGAPGDGSASVEASGQYVIAGGGIKGPLAHASVELYALDTSFDALFDANDPLASATTNAYAQIDGLVVPAGAQPPFVLVIDGSNAIDRNTGVAPVISKLVTVITRESLEARQPIYATPYTTLAYHMLRQEAAIIAGNAPQTGPAQPSAEGLVAIEAENPSANVSQSKASWEPVPTDGASGNIAMQALPSTVGGNTDPGYSDVSPRLDYSFSVDAPGTYYVWLRVIGPASSANSVHVGIDHAETPAEDNIRFPVSSSWSWQGGPGDAGFRVNKVGMHTLNVWMRESGAIVDKVVVTTDPDYVPRGTGPAETGFEVAAAQVVDLPLAETLQDFNTVIVRGVGFGMARKTDIFTTSPIITAATNGVATQQLVVNYRAAIEALSALVYQMSGVDPNGRSTDVLLESMASDLYDDGMINAMLNGLFSGILAQSPMALEIPNTGYQVRDTVDLISEERALVGGGSNVVFHDKAVTVALRPMLSAAQSGGQSAGDNGQTGSNLGQQQNSGSSGASGDTPFAHVPVPSGRMNFAWYEDAKAMYTASQPDDPMDWAAAYNRATKRTSVSSCNQLQNALNQAGPGHMILVDSGEYNGCSLSITRSGTQAAPIVVTASAKALNRSGTVTFKGGSTFANIRNAASHYVIGGFRFIGQSISVFDIEAGKTTTDGSGKTVYEDGSTDIRFTDSHYEGIGRARGAKDGVIVVGVRSHRIRVDHSSFISNYNHVRYRNNKDAGSLFSTSKDGRVDHNYFGPAATSGFLSGVHYEIGAFQTCCGDIGEDSDTLTLTFEYNVIEQPKTQNADPEILEIKTAGIVVKNNIIWSEGFAISLRYSFNATVESNYLIGTGIMVHGANHIISDNYIDGNNRLKAGIAMPRWGRRQPDNCTTLPPTHDNLIAGNTILNTAEYGMRIGDCDYGACRPVTNSRIMNNRIQSDSGVLVHYNERREPGRKNACRNDKSKDAAGGANTGNTFSGNVFAPKGSASNGSARKLDKKAKVK